MPRWKDWGAWVTRVEGVFSLVESWVMTLDPVLIHLEVLYRGVSKSRTVWQLRFHVSYFLRVYFWGG